VSYTNVGCPAEAAVQHVATYQAEPNTPMPAYAVPSASDDIDARVAREAARAREIGYREGQQAAQDEAAADREANTVYYPGFAGGAPFRGHHDDRHHGHPQAHATGKATTVRGSIPIADGRLTLRH